MRALVAGLPLVLAACFDPTFNNPACGPAGECPAEMTCVSGVCRAMAVDDPDAEPGSVDARTTDAEIPDADPTAPDATDPCDAWTYAPANVPCTAPTGAWNVTVSSTLNTDTGAVSAGTAPASAIVTQTGSTQLARLVVVDAFSVSASTTLDVVGSLPLIILVHGGATIDGVLDASAQATTPGAGGNATQCDPSATGDPGGDATTGGGGGGGGGFGGSGGFGGEGGNGTAGNGGTAISSTLATLSPLRGGCPGGKGGDDEATNGGAGGAGGGALQIAARDSITIAGTVQVGGGGGRGATPTDGGGGGGGSGGAILLEAPSITTTGLAKLCANSGAGGEGAGSSPGNHGGSAVCQAPAVGGSGGSSVGGDGGDGTQGSVVNGQAGSNGGSSLPPYGGGGGGAGGRGIIRIRGALTNGGLITPAASTVAL